MGQPNLEGFNKEKLIFLAVAAATAAALYLFLASSPVPLTPDQPVGTQPLPQVFENLALDIQRDERWYVDGPSRQRKTPFAPASDYRLAKPAAKPGGNAPPPPPPPPPKNEKEKPGQTEYNATELNIQVEFSGIVMRGGDTFALLKFKDGSGTRRVRAGDTIPELKYTITRIDKQAVWATDEENRPFVLKDGRDDGGSSAGSGSAASAETPHAKKQPSEKKTHAPAPPATPASAHPQPPAAQPGTPARERHSKHPRTREKPV